MRVTRGIELGGYSEDFVTDGGGFVNLDFYERAVADPRRPLVMLLGEGTFHQFIADNILFSHNGFPYADDTSFLESGIINSMNVMEIVSFSEKTFGISIRDEEIVPDNLDSITKLSSFIRRKIAEGR